MKSWILISLVAAAITSYAQPAYIAAGVEGTIVGVQYGISVGYISKKGFQAGGFYQLGSKSTETSSASLSLYGIETIIPLVSSKKITFGIHARAGVANRQFIVVVPGVITLINLPHGIQAGVSAGWRYGNPAAGLHVQFKL